MGDEKHPLKLEDIPVMNFGKYMIETMKAFSEAPGIIEGSTGKSYSYNDIVTRSERLAAGLQHLGVQEGDVICIFAPNHLDYSVAFYATALINAIFQAVNPLFPKDDLRKVIRECESKYIFTTPALLPKVQEAREGLENIQVIVLDEAENFTSLESVLAPEGTPYNTPDRDWKCTIAALLYSSGTTGFPKPVQTSHFALTANTIQLNYAGVNVKRESLVSFLPMFHYYGLIVVGAVSHTQGSKVVFMSRFFPEEYLSLIETHKPPALHVVPPIMVMFAKHPKVSEYDLSSVKKVICGAAPLSEKIEEAVKNKLNLNIIQQGYGMTEAGVTHANQDDDFRYKSVGKLMDLAEMKLVDVETGKTLGPNEEGEVWLRGPQVSCGYLGLPDRNKELFQDGWVKTGDVGKVDEDGFLFIVDRLKELIKYKAYQVAPATLEDILLRHECVGDAGVIGVPDEEAGEIPRAYVVKKAGKDVTESELQDFVAGLVAPYMKLRGGVEFLSEIPRSASGKILRRTLRERAKLSA